MTGRQKSLCRDGTDLIRVTYFNHPHEIGEQAQSAIQRLEEAGAPLLNQ